MTDRMIENRIHKLKELEAQQKAIEEQAEAIRSELKADLEARGTEEVTTEHGITIRWKAFWSDRLDTKWLKREEPEVYERFVIPQQTRRFTVSAQ